MIRSNSQILKGPEKSEPRLPAMAGVGFVASAKVDPGYLDPSDSVLPMAGQEDCTSNYRFWKPHIFPKPIQ